MDEHTLKRRDILRSLAGAGALGAVSGPVTGKQESHWNGDETAGEYVVGIDPGHKAAESARSQAKDTSLRLRREIELGDIRTAISGVYTTADVETLREQPAVSYVEKDYLLEPLATEIEGKPAGSQQSINSGEYPWGIDRIGADQAHDAGQTGEGVDIVIIDTGAQPDHPGLKANLDVGKAFGDGACTEQTRQYETVSCSEPWADDQYHGTHVSGSAGAVDTEIVDSENPSVSVERIAGVAPDATLHAANVFEWRETSNGWASVAPSSNTANAIQWAADQGYDVMNASLGGPSQSFVIQDALKYATNENDLVFVAAAGNSGQKCGQDPYNDDPDDCVGYPAAFPEAIAVGNTTVDDEIAPSSSRGPEVEIAAPGKKILSSMPKHVKNESSTVDSNYWWLTGTSMASPHVAGLAALIKAETSIEDNEAIREQIKETAEDIGLRDVESGNGLIDVQAALDVSQVGVKTLDATTITGSEATLQGELTSLGDASSADVYFEYWEEGTDQTNTTSAQTLSETGSFETAVSGLQSNTTYVFEAVADADGTTTRGGEATFSTTTPLVVRTKTAGNVTSSEATLKGSLDNLGGASSVDVYFEYKEKGTDNTQTTSPKTRSKTGGFNTTVTGLKQETTYVFKAVASTGDKVDKGDKVSFSTLAPLAVTTTEATDFGTSTATLQGTLDELGGASSVDVSFEYWEDGTEQTQTTTAQSLTSTGEFTEQVTGLESDTTYKYRARAETTDQTVQGDTVSFITVAETIGLPTIDTTGAGNATFTRRGELYTIEAAGVTTDSSRNNEYGAIYHDDLSGDLMAQTTVAEQQNTADEATAGIRVANDITAGSNSIGDLLVAATPGRGFLFAWDDNADGMLTKEVTTDESVTYPCELRVEKADSTFTGMYSTDGGATWTEIDTVTIPEAKETQDVGLSTSSESDATLCRATFDGFTLGDVTVRTKPASQELAATEQTTVDLVVRHATSGVGSYTLDLTVDDISLLKIADYTITNTPQTSNSNLAEDGSTLHLEVNLGTDVHDPGDPVIATVTLEGVNPGTADLALTNVSIADTGAVPYDIALTRGTQTAVTEPPGPPPVSGDKKPTDPDGDGRYEDVNGDGTFNIFDVQTFFTNLKSDVVQNNPEAFNFDDDSSNNVNIFDVQALFTELVTSESGSTDELDAEIDDPEAIEPDELAALLDE